jgi:long-subunit acyl-CoA synthetase (AMP-forming)
MTTAISLPLSRFYDREDRHPDKCFLVQPMAGGQVEKLSWSEVGDQARRVAHWLRRQGLRRGSAIAIISDNCAHWMMTDLAIWMAGHVSVPLSPDLGADAVARVLKHSEVALVFVGKLDDWARMSVGVSPGVPTVAMPLHPEGTFDFCWNELQAWSPIKDNPIGHHDQLATIIYTSGTTGLPKGVMHSFGSLAFAATHGAAVLGLGERDRLLSCLPLCCMAERMFVQIMSIYTGQTVFFADSPQTFMVDLRRVRPTALLGVPRIWSQLQAVVYTKIPTARLERFLRFPLLSALVGYRIRRQLGLDALRVALCGAAPIPDSLLDWYRQVGVDILPVYGLTENGGYSHIGRAGQRKGGWIGQPCPQVDVRIAEDGEVLLRSGATMAGYFNDPLKTAEALTVDGFLHTGDKGEQDEHGNLRLTGRLTDITQPGNDQRVAPLPVEHLTAASARVEQVCVRGARYRSFHSG